MANKFPLILNTSANQIQELASGDNLDLTGSGIHNAGVITATSFSGNITGGVTGNADTATEATNVTVSANNSNDETVYPIFVDGATGTQGAESDTGLTYNPSSGNLTATRLSGTVMVPAQPNITSVGTLSSLDVSGNVSIGGTLTYEDVTNIDSVGLVTARIGLVSPYADIDDWIDVGNNIQLGNAGIVTAKGADINGDIDVDGHTNLDNVNVAGVSTFTGGVNVQGLDVNGTLDVDGHTNLDNVSIAGVTTTQDVTFTGASANMSWIKSSNALNIAAGGELHIGDNAEFKGYRSGTHTYLAHTNSNGNFFIKSQANIALQAGGSTTGINVNGSGDVTLTHSGDIKLATTATGINITGICTATSFSGPLKEGDTEVSVNDTGSNGEVTLKANNLNVLKAISLGNNYGAIGINQFTNRHSAVSIAHTGTSTPDPNISLTSPSVAVGGGTGIFMKSSNDISLQKRYGTWLQSVRSDLNNGSPDFIIMKEDAAANGLSEHFRIDKNGQVLPGVDNTQNLGSSTKRWANIYSADLQLSNEGKTNDVDGTWGNYTIQEGESELFLINNRSGKKYKFNLTEVN